MHYSTFKLPEGYEPSGSFLIKFLKSIFLRGDFMGGKFDDVDRYLTKEWLENHLKTNLKQFGRKRKYFLGDDGKCYCILGGQVFHGIPKEIINSESRECIDTELVIVKKYKDKFEIYMNSIEKFIENKKMLSYSEKGKQ
ncbi:MAG: hypothetical protein JSW07_07415, partial [bacterium]